MSSLTKEEISKIKEQFKGAGYTCIFPGEELRMVGFMPDNVLLIDSWYKSYPIYVFESTAIDGVQVVLSGLREGKFYESKHQVVNSDSFKSRLVGTLYKDNLLLNTAKEIIMDDMLTNNGRIKSSTIDEFVSKLIEGL